MRRPAFRFAIVVALMAALSGVPSSAFAALMASVLAFGQHTAPVNFMTQPIGIAECSGPVNIQFTGITSFGMTAQVIDVWRAASVTTACDTGAMARTGAAQVCSPVPVAMGNTVTGQTQFEMMVTPTELFGTTMVPNPCAGAGVTATQYFFFAQTGSSGDASTVWPPGTFLAMPIAIDTQRPSAPVLAGDSAGDVTVALAWTNPSDLTSQQGGVNVYFDPAGCGGGDGGSASSVLIAGQMATGTPAYSVSGQSISSTSVPIARLGWAADRYNQTGAVAVSVYDSARNESVLSNVVCVEHVNVTGFWNEYCAERGLTVAECSARYRGCSVGLPSRRPDLMMIGTLTLVLCVFFARRRTR